MEGVVRHWRRQCRAVVESQSLEVFKKCVTVAPVDRVSAEPGTAGLMVGFDHLGGLFQPW